MKKILLISHFGLAEGMKNTLRYFNEEVSESLVAINAYDDNDDPKDKIAEFMNSVKEEDTVFIFSDILGGSVNQYCLPYLERKKTYVFTGMNLGMILQATFIQDDASEEEIYHLEKVGKDSVVCMNTYEFEAFSDEDE